MPAFDRLIQKSRFAGKLLEWRRLLESDPSTRVISQNFNRETELNSSLHPVLENFIDRLGEYLADKGLKENAESLISLKADETPYLHLRGGSIKYSKYLSRIMSLEDIDNYLSHHMGWAAGDLNQIRNAILNDNFVPRGVLRTRRPFCWVTKGEYIDELRKLYSNPEELSGAIVTGLGLLHLAQIELCEIAYPEWIEPPLYRPTVLDAGASKIFRPCIDKGDFGRAINLLSLRNGGPEAIHNQMGCGDGFEVRIVGRTDSEVVMDWDELYNSNHPGVNL